MKIPGYITEKEASAEGFTHHGRYFGIPVWIAPDNQDFTVAAKWAPLEYVMTAVLHLERFVRPIIFPDDEPCFQFSVLKEINPTREKS